MRFITLLLALVMALSFGCAKPVIKQNILAPACTAVTQTGTLAVLGFENDAMGRVKSEVESSISDVNVGGSKAPLHRH